MLKKFLFVLFCSILGFNLACGSAAEPNATANANGGNSAVANQTLPAGITTSPMPVSGNTPGIPANATVVNMNALPKGATPIPGIDPKKANQPLKPGGTPTPGIPDPKTMQKQNVPPMENPNSSQSDSPNRPASNKVDSVNKPPTVRKP
ncbi:MAG TPA: hypothetical protein VF604_10880 [Pyrinomonadaceae bacterium]